MKIPHHFLQAVHNTDLNKKWRDLETSNKEVKRKHFLTKKNISSNLVKQGCTCYNKNIYCKKNY